MEKHPLWCSHNPCKNKNPGVGPDGSRVWDPCGPGPAKNSGVGPRVIPPSLNDFCRPVESCETPDTSCFVFVLFFFFLLLVNPVTLPPGGSVKRHLRIPAFPCSTCGCSSVLTLLYLGVKIQLSYHL